MFSSSLFMYLCSMSHSICSLISFLEGRNILRNISTSSVCKAALVILFLIFIILTIASCNETNNCQPQDTVFTFTCTCIILIPSILKNCGGIFLTIQFCKKCFFTMYACKLRAERQLFEIQTFYLFLKYCRLKVPFG